MFSPSASALEGVSGADGGHDGGDDGSPGGGDAPSWTPQGVAPNASSIFQNSNLSESQWINMEDRITKMKQTTIGTKLYNKILERVTSCGSKFLISIGDANSFNYNTCSIVLEPGAHWLSMFEEMYHLYQQPNFTAAQWDASIINIEIEAKYAKYLAWKELPANVTNFYRGGDNFAIRNLGKYLDSQGNLRDDVDEANLQKRITMRVLPELDELGYKPPKYNYNSSISAIDNFSTLRNLTNPQQP
jgi:hypothetical protein